MSTERGVKWNILESGPQKVPKSKAFKHFIQNQKMIEENESLLHVKGEETHKPEDVRVHLMFLNFKRF